MHASLSPPLPVRPPLLLATHLYLYLAHHSCLPRTHTTPGATLPFFSTHHHRAPLHFLQPLSAGAHCLGSGVARPVDLLLAYRFMGQRPCAGHFTETHHPLLLCRMSMVCCCARDLPGCHPAACLAALSIPAAHGAAALTWRVCHVPTPCSRYSYLIPPIPIDAPHTRGTLYHTAFLRAILGMRWRWVSAGGSYVRDCHTHAFTCQCPSFPPAPPTPTPPLRRSSCRQICQQCRRATQPCLQTARLPFQRISTRPSGCSGCPPPYGVINMPC